ncbi:MAG: D-tyrosyl-tRNA(Tyr) deacylase [Desulfobulbaceae bacterium]|mgnify:CR=1 FL=1|nr:MAG: D-tyrosyl-tRNA(Tyr) deacylase [Desulfobulbaceae bacterium]
MRAVVQRVKEAKVTVRGTTSGRIAAGVLIFLGVTEEDSQKDASYLADKIVNLRIFPDAEDKMNLSLLDTQGGALIVSQFTLYGDCRKGRRPSYAKAAHPLKAEELYNFFIKGVAAHGITVATGVFQAMMDVQLINDGPVTLLLDSRKDF